MNLYLSAVDDLMKSENENQAIRLLLCKSKSEVIAEIVSNLYISNPLQLFCKFTGKCHAISYYSYTQHCNQFEKKEIL